MAPDCLVCQEIECAIPVPGGVLWEEPLALGFHVPPLAERGDPYLGHVLVVTRRHVAGLAQLTPEEAAAVGRGAAELARALVAAAGATHVHAAVAGLAVPHLHQHLLPRFPDTPPDVSWHAVGDGPHARRGGAEEIAALAERLRAALEDAPAQPS